MKVVGRYFKIVVLLVVVAAVTTILLTPTLSDDVPGIMHRNHNPVAITIAVGLLQVAALIRSCHSPQENPNHQLFSSNFLELVCQHLC